MYRYTFCFGYGEAPQIIVIEAESLNAAVRHFDTAALPDEPCAGIRQDEI